jgi:hypothetical protein
MADALFFVSRSTPSGMEMDDFYLVLFSSLTKSPLEPGLTGDTNATKNCGFCLFPLKSTATACSLVTDVSVRNPAWDVKFTVAEVAASAARGCPFCSSIHLAIEKSPSVSELEPNQQSNITLVWEPENYGLSVSNGEGARLCRITLCDIKFPPPGDGEPHPYITPWPVTVNRHVRQIRSLVRNCVSDHSECAIAHEAPPLPHRVIRVSRSGEGLFKVNLVETNGACGQYVCLSHCWGSLRPDCITTPLTYARNLNEIPWDSLPATFQRAVAVTHILDLEYIWIDSMCIIQEDSEDWKEEAPEMRRIYSQAYITLMATMSRDGSGGLLSPFVNPKSIEVLSIMQQAVQSEETYDRFRAAIPTLSSRAEMKATLGDFSSDSLLIATSPIDRLVEVLSWDSHVRDDSSHPLLSRAWVFQERLLSRRTLHFTIDGLFYECAQNPNNRMVEGDFSNMYPLIHDPNTYLHLVKNDSGNKQPQQHQADLYSVKGRFSRVLENPELGEVRGFWWGIIEGYSGLFMTLERDKLPALSGIAREFGQKAAHVLGRYIAGCWEKTFTNDILWGGGYAPTRQLFGRPRYWRSPTWSWASNNGFAHPPISLQTSKLMILSYDIELAGKDEFGELKSASVMAATRLLECTLKYRGCGSTTTVPDPPSIEEILQAYTPSSVREDDSFYVELLGTKTEVALDYDVSQEGGGYVASGATLFLVDTESPWDDSKVPKRFLLLRCVDDVRGVYERVGCAGGPRTTDALAKIQYKVLTAKWEKQPEVIVTIA